MQILIHLGAHKTATTYLQSRLKRGADALAGMGVEIVPLAEMRRAVSAPLGIAATGGLRGALARRNIRGALSAFAEKAHSAGCTRLVLSDENLLGNCGRLLTDATLYSGLRRRLEVLQAALPEAETTILLSVRNYATFFASAWGQRLRGGRHAPFDAPLRDRLMAMPRGWMDVISDIGQAFPAARLIAWPYEWFGDLEETVLATLVGPGAVNGVPAIKGRPLAGFSARSVAEIEARLDGTGEVPRDVVHDLHRAWPKGPHQPAFDPWPEAESAELRARYANDLAAISARLGPGFLRCMDPLPVAATA